MVDQLGREKGLPQKVHAEAARLRLHNDEVTSTETDVLSSGCDPMVATQDDDPVKPSWADAWAGRHGEVLLQQRPTDPPPVAPRHRCLKLAHSRVPV